MKMSYTTRPNPPTLDAIKLDTKMKEGGAKGPILITLI